MIVDAGYGNNTSFLLELENRKLKYLGGVAKNRKVTISEQQNNQQTIRLDELAQSSPQEDFSEIQINLDKPRTVWLTGGFRRRWATKPLNTFVDALDAFRTAISFRFIEWLTLNRDVFASHKASLGFIWA